MRCQDKHAARSYDDIGGNQQKAFNQNSTQFSIFRMTNILIFPRYITQWLRHQHYINLQYDIQMNPYFIIKYFRCMLKFGSVYFPIRIQLSTSPFKIQSNDY